jgi:hypothetical protein
MFLDASRLKRKKERMECKLEDRKKETKKEGRMRENGMEGGKGRGWKIWGRTKRVKGRGGEGRWTREGEARRVEGGGRGSKEGGR